MTSCSVLEALFPSTFLPLTLIYSFLKIPMQHTLPLYKLAGFMAFLFRDYKMLTI